MKKVHNPETVKPDKNLAKLLYFSLPDSLRHNVTSFLSVHERGVLSQSPPPTLSAIRYSALTRLLKWKNSSSNLQKKNSYGYMYFVFHAAFCMTALFYREYVAAISAIVYGITGALFLSKKSSLYIKMRLHFSFHHPEYLIYSGLIFTVSFLTLGYINLPLAGNQDSSIIMIQAILLAPLFEEFFFREVLFDIFAKTVLPAWSIVVLTAFLFSLVHINMESQFIEFIVYFNAGVLLGSLRWITSSLALPIITHAAINTTILFL